MGIGGNMRSVNARLDRLEQRTQTGPLPTIGLVVSHEQTDDGVERDIEAYVAANPTHLGPLVLRVEGDDA